MGTCASSPQLKSYKENTIGGKSGTSTPTTEKAAAESPPQAMSQEERHQYVREMAMVVLDAFEQNLKHYEKHPDIAQKDASSDSAPWMHSMVNSLKNEFNPLASRLKPLLSQERTDTTYLIPRDKIKEFGLTSFPKHEDALAMGLLKTVDIEDMRIKLCREANRGIHTHFISHKWDGNSPDTKDNVLFEKSKDAAHYLWFDYTCVPQDDHELRLRHLLAIANICQEATVVPFHANAELEEAYNRSVWCQLEAALLTWDITNFDPATDWTIYDWNDLYAVLPGFLDLWVNTEKNWRFFDGNAGLARTSMVVSLLRAFLQFDDTRCA